VIELMAADGGKGAVALDGRMIDRPHVLQAERILATAGRR
jgi:citrate lyase subunit beta/citryl-CoA lyase